MHGSEGEGEGEGEGVLVPGSEGEGEGEVVPVSEGEGEVVPGSEGVVVPGRGKVGWRWWWCGVGVVLSWGQLGCHVARGQVRARPLTSQSTTRELATPTLCPRYPVGQ